jgi:hypothetical protein
VRRTSRGCASSASACRAAALLRLLVSSASERASTGELGTGWPGFSGSGGVRVWGTHDSSFARAGILPSRGPCHEKGESLPLPAPWAVGVPPNPGPGGRSGTLSARFEVSLLPPGGSVDAPSCIHVLRPERSCVHDRIPTRTQHPSPSSTQRKNRASTAHERRTLRHPQTPARPRTQPGRAPSSPVEAFSGASRREAEETQPQDHEMPRQRSRRTRWSRASADAGRGGAEPAQPQDEREPRESATGLTRPPTPPPG